PPPGTDPPVPARCVLGRGAGGQVVIRSVAADGTPRGAEEVAADEHIAGIARFEAEHSPRWVFSDAAVWYPRLLAAGVTLERCHDLRLVHRILRHSQLVTDPGPLREATAWDTPLEPEEPRRDLGATLFDLDARPSAAHGVPDGIEETGAELERQLSAIASAEDPARLRLLLAAESAGALIAAELQAAGIPWDVAEHDRILEDALGPRPSPGTLPSQMVQVAAE